jgi:hypothetical protein
MGKLRPVSVDTFDALARAERRPIQPRPVLEPPEVTERDGRRRLGGVPRTTCLLDREAAERAAILADQTTVKAAAAAFGVHPNTLALTWQRYGISSARRRSA